MSDENEYDELDIDVDFGNVTEYEALGAGEYIFTISDAQIKPTKDKTGHNIVVSLEVEQPVEFSGKPQKAWVYIYPENPFGVKQFAEAALDMDLSDYNGGVKQIVAEVQGKSVGGTIEEGTYNGKPSSSVKAWWPASGQTRTMDDPVYGDQEPF